MKIAQYLDSSPWGDVTPENIYQHGMGGRETALVNLGENWAKQGHDVINLVKVDKPYTKTLPQGNGSITYASKDLAVDYLSNFEHDVLVSWEEPRLCAVPEIRERVSFAVIEMQVAHLINMQQGLDQYIDGYAVLSEWAGEFLSQTDQRIDRKKISILPNGVDLDRYPNPKNQFPEPPYKFHYTSSPDRGLNHLLKLWPKILEKFPGSEMIVAYGVENWLAQEIWSHFEVGQVAADVVDGLRQENIRYVGKVGQDELAEIHAQSSALLYPCDTMVATETGCITAIESAAAGTPMVLTDCDCLEQEFGDVALIHPLPYREEGFLYAVETLMGNKQLYEELQERGRKFAESRSWELISQTWLKYFESEVD
jgi:glycosyltransferase involved in cell wall biosynthesis